MPELRIILLVVGVLFVAGIAGFEWWRSRGQRPSASVSRPGAREDVRPGAREDVRGGARDDHRTSARDDVHPGSRNEAAGDSAFEPRAGEREMKSLPEINVVREPRMPLSDSLPVIELASTSESGTRRALGIAISDEVAVDFTRDPASTRATSPEPAPAPVQSIEPEEPHFGRDGVSEPRVVPEPVSPEAPNLTLVWPSEGERRIVTLRVLPKSEPRFAGRALRQAFNGCGFWHGPMDIFHMPDEQGRVMISAAALAQPGTFDPSIMDSQRFSGLNLFAVLPGPVAEREIFEELVHAARQLAERLGGQITDQHGEELTAERIGRLRQSLESAPPAARAGQG